MNRAFSSLVKSLLVATLAVSGFASAAQPAAAVVKADPAKGQDIYTAGRPAAGVQACVTCHGAAGNSTMAANPKLASQIEQYTYKQLVDFTTPARKGTIMSAFAAKLSDQEKKDLAAFLATAKIDKPGAAKNKDTVELGMKIYRGGIAGTGVAACASCHGANGNGIPSQFPRIAGQHQEYTLAQLKAFKDGTRKNSVQMTTLSKRMSDEEMQAVADYIAGLK